MKHAILSLCWLGVIFGDPNGGFAQSPEDLYQVQLGAYAEAIDWSRFQGLQDLGLVMRQSIRAEEPNDGLIRVYLGKYLGRQTLEHVLAQLKKRGFMQLGLDQNDYTLRQGNGPSLRYTVQLGVFSQLDMQTFSRLEAPQNLLIQYEDRKWKVLYGLYASPEDAREALQTLSRQGHTGIIKAFR